MTKQQENPFKKRRGANNPIVEEIDKAGRADKEADKKEIGEKIEKEIEKEGGKKGEEEGGKTPTELIEKKRPGIEHMEQIEIEEKIGEELDMSFLDSILQKPKKEESKGKNLYLNMDNIKFIEKFSKKAGKSHSQFVDDLLTEVFKMMK